MIASLKRLVLRRQTDQAAKAALAWLHAHTDSFRIAETRDEQGTPWTIKPLGELLFMLIILKRHGVRRREIEGMSAFALREADTFDWHELAAYDPSAATPMAFIAEFFALHDRPAPFETTYFDFLRRIDFFEGMDRFPYREMDLAYSFSRIGVPNEQPRINLWFASTAFGRGQNLARYTIDDLYSLTHAVMYLTDVGLVPPHGHLDPSVLERLHRELVTLTAMMLRADNTDVLGELLLCWILAGIAPTPFERSIFAAGLRRMFGSTATDGAVAPTSRIKLRADAGEATFAELYHTTLVSAILFSLAARRAL